MKLSFLIVFAVAMAHCASDNAQHADKAMTPSPAAQTTTYDRLPEGITLGDKVKREVKNGNGDVVSFTIITVEESLKELGAKYQNDILVDRDGREIRFYTPPVRGASQGLEEDAAQRERDAKELAELQKKYTVIILYVDPLKVG
jgi:hypothetical protein